MELDKLSIEQYKRHLLRLFERFIAFCDEHSLNYFCAGGTMLGAVRHHGLIPWDDDIDLFMMRKDYEKLISLQPELSKRGIGLEGIQCNMDFAVFLKLWDMRTTLWEIEEIPYVYGVFIDIFPLDYSDDSLSQFLVKYKKRRLLSHFYQLSHMRFDLKSLKNRLIQKDFKFVVKDILSLFVPHFLSGYIRTLILREDERNQKERGCNIASYYGDYWEREYLKKEWFDNTILVDFDNLKVKIPVGFDEYLSQIYDDYMKLPPIEKRITHHYHFYLNLDKGMTIGEVMEEMDDINKQAH